MSKFLDSFGTSMQSWQIGLKQSGAKTLNFVNSFVGSVSWNPTANRTLTLPDKTGIVACLDDVTNAAVASISADKTLGLGDINTILIGSNSGNINVTVPTNATTAIPIGSEIALSPTAQDQLRYSVKTTVLTRLRLIVTGRV